jgi:hypothetical protein
MRRAASRLFQPAQVSMTARASVRRVFRGCLGAPIGACIYIVCRYMERRNMQSMTDVRYGLPTRAEVAGKETGRVRTEAGVVAQGRQISSAEA